MFIFTGFPINCIAIILSDIGVKFMISIYTIESDQYHVYAYYFVYYYFITRMIYYMDLISLMAATRLCLDPFLPDKITIQYILSTYNFHIHALKLITY
jgi:hypothetical protein